MRPVDRGDVPRDDAGQPKVFANYASARFDLFKRLGRYCSFCERPIKAGLAVEHVLPRSHFPNLVQDWQNFLLACTNCNSTKGSRPASREHQLLPDHDNTFRGLAYSEGGLVSVHSNVPPAIEPLVNCLIRLVGLDRSPTHDPQAKDLRWNDRREAWDKAARYRKKYETNGLDPETVIDLCEADGHWSIWMTVFADVGQIRSALIRDFPGTCTECFDPRGDAVLRPGGRY